MTDIDFGRTANDYATHRAGFPDVLYDRLERFGLGLAGQRALDVGTGTGTVARALASRGLIVDALDPSSELMAEGERLARESGIEVGWHQGRAEETPFDDSGFDFAIAGQCWHWFDAARAANEMLRVLKPGGALVIAHFDWIPLPGNAAKATERLILEHNPEWAGAGGMGVYPWWYGHMSMAGFVRLESFTVDVDVPYSHEAWRGRVRASAGVAASLSSEGVRAFDTALARLLASEFPEDPLAIGHRLSALVGWKPATAP